MYMYSCAFKYNKFFFHKILYRIPNFNSQKEKILYTYIYIQYTTVEKKEIYTETKIMFYIYIQKKRIYTHIYTQNVLF